MTQRAQRSQSYAKSFFEHFEILCGTLRYKDERPTHYELKMIFQHEDDGYPVAELSPDSIVLSTAQEFLQVMMNAGGDRIIIHQSNLDDSFFDLSTGVAGDMLQKVVNYQLRLAIVGDFSMYESKSLKAFIAESNRSNTIVFVGSVEEGLERLRA